jgi:MFS family permease
MVQGAAAAVMAPSALSIIVATFPDGRERNKALGAWGVTGGIGGTAGALLGGLVTDGLGWPWIFFVNVPVCAVLLVLCPMVLCNRRIDVRQGPFDLLGAASVTAALLVLIYAVVQAPANGWTTRPRVHWRVRPAWSDLLASRVAFDRSADSVRVSWLRVV